MSAQTELGGHVRDPTSPISRRDRRDANRPLGGIGCCCRTRPVRISSDQMVERTDEYRDSRFLLSNWSTPSRTRSRYP